MNTEEAARAVGVSFRQVSYWLQTGVMQLPAKQYDGSPGREFHYVWRARDVERLRTVAQVMTLGGAVAGKGDGPTTAARLAMKHWRKGPGWLVLSPIAATGVLAKTPESIPKAVRRVGHRALVVPLP